MFGKKSDEENVKEFLASVEALNKRLEKTVNNILKFDDTLEMLYKANHKPDDDEIKKLNHFAEIFRRYLKIIYRYSKQISNLGLLSKEINKEINKNSLKELIEIQNLIKEFGTIKSIEFQSDAYEEEIIKMKKNLLILREDIDVLDNEIEEFD